jgi:hypothetical protein
MGRGRAKAKQQKVARDLKYNSHPTDLDALQRELSHTTPTSVFVDEDPLDDDEADDGDEWASAAR